MCLARIDALDCIPVCDVESPNRKAELLLLDCGLQRLGLGFRERSSWIASGHDRGQAEVAILGVSLRHPHHQRDGGNPSPGSGDFGEIATQEYLKSGELHCQRW